MEYHLKHRPRKLEGIVGQVPAVASLKRLIEKQTIPHVILLTGPSGTGKTTIARILRSTLKCSKMDYMEIDCAVVDSPIETVRNIRRGINMRPIDGPCRIYFLEEVQSLSKAGFSQQALLKMLEDVPAHAYFILATTDVQKLHRAVVTRCFEVRLQSLARTVLLDLVASVAKAEGVAALNEDVADEIVEAADGSARKALVILEQVVHLKTTKEQLSCIQTTTASKDRGIQLARILINPQGTWKEVAALLKEITDEPESIRYLVLGYCRSVMLGNNTKLAARAYMIIDVFSGNFYDSKAAGLAAACWEVMN